MKKMILSLMSVTLGCAAFAANCVSVRQISTDYSNHQITIALTRNGCTGDNTNHRNTVWVFVDYCETGSSVWTRATISAASAGTVVNSGNSKGAWIYGANGTQAVTLTLSGMPAKYDWCAFATDYPPNVVAAGGVYTFKGAPPFVLQPATGSAQTVTQTTLATAALTVAPVSIMDATGCTGTFCPYSGSDLYIDATHICQQRTGGAQNWEAWIKDTRDNELYRIVHMPDNKWWLAQNVKYAGTGAVNTRSGCTKDKCGRLYSGAQMNSAQGGTSGTGANKQGICPGGWVLPLVSDFRQMVDVIDKITYFVSGNGYITGVSSTINQRLGCLAPAGYSPNDYYGWANEMASWTNMPSTTAGHEGWRSNDANNCDWSLLLNHIAGHGDYCGYMSLQCSSLDRVAPVRCWRIL